MKPEGAAVTVKQMMQDHIETMAEIHRTQVELLKASLRRQAETVVDGIGSVVGEIDSQTEDFKAMMGQITNQSG